MSHLMNDVQIKGYSWLAQGKNTNMKRFIIEVEIVRSSIVSLSPTLSKYEIVEQHIWVC